MERQGLQAAMIVRNWDGNEAFSECIQKASENSAKFPSLKCFPI